MRLPQTKKSNILNQYNYNCSIRECWHATITIDIAYKSLFCSWFKGPKERDVGDANGGGDIPTFLNTTVGVVLIKNAKLLCLGGISWLIMSFHKTQLNILYFVYLFPLVFLYCRVDLCTYSRPYNSYNIN
jgi:hypothetical protein